MNQFATPASTKAKHWLGDHAPHAMTSVLLKATMANKSPFKWSDKERNAIFVHIPKTAGTSIKQCLFGGEHFGHCRIADYYLFDPERADKAFKFCFVRNPWDRFLSAYTYLASGRQRTAQDIAFAASILSDQPTFEAFCHALREPRLRHRVMTYDHFREQIFWISLAQTDRIAMDFIGKFERFDSDWSTLCGRLNVSADTLPHARSSNARTYRDHYSSQMRSIVGEIYRDDIERLGYDF